MKHGSPFLAAIAIPVFILVAAVTAASADANDLPFPHITWVDSGPVAEDAGVSAGLAWGDYDNDGDPDLYIANWRDQPGFLYRNDDGRFSRIVEGPIATDSHLGSGPVWGDYDGDGDLDLFLATQQNEHNALYRNEGDDRFVRVTDGPLVSDFGDSYSAAWADANGDGHLDLAVANSTGQRNFLYRNLGDGRFELLADGPLAEDQGNHVGVSWADVDDDGDQDLFFASFGPEPSVLYRNDGDFRFVRTTALEDETGRATGGAFADFDGDGDLDLHLSRSRGFFTPEVDLLLRNDGGFRFTPVESAAISESRRSVASSWADLDYDGDLDLLVLRYLEPNLLAENTGEGTFRAVDQDLAVAAFSSGHGWADFDLDGDLDLAVANWQNQDNTLFTASGVQGGFLRVRLRQAGPNRFAVGASVRLASDTARERWQRRDVTAGGSFRSQEPLDLTFGLGEAGEASPVIVRWPDGLEERFEGLAANRRVTIERGRGVVDEWAPNLWPRRHIAQAYAVVPDGESVESAEERFLEWRRKLDAYGTDLGGFVDAYIAIRERGADPVTLDRIVRFWADALPDLYATRHMEIIALRSLGLQDARDRAERDLIMELDELEGLTERDRRRIRREAEHREHHEP